MSARGIFRRGLLAVLTVLVAGGAARAPAQQAAGGVQTKPATAGEQTTSTTSTISVDARLVNIPVVVRDKKGALVQNLTKDNFVLQVDDHPQAIRYFNLDTELPLTLGLLVDTSESQRDVIDDERTASGAFLDDMLTAPDDRDKAFVVQFARQTDLLQDVTSSKPKLREGLKQLSTPSFGGGSGGSSSDSDSSGSARGGTTLYDALFLSSDELMSKQTGRKAVIILSDGVDRGSKESLASSIEAAQRADTIVYAIYYQGRQTFDRGNGQNQGGRGGGYPGGRGGIGFPGGGGGYPGGGGGGGGRGGGQGGPTGPEARTDGKKTLQRMADETGGRLFEVSRKETVAQIYKDIGEELRAQYRLAFTPDDKTASDGYHQIDLTVTKSSPKDLYIQTRDGYYADK